jgi:hypothetical protein
MDMAVVMDGAIAAAADIITGGAEVVATIKGWRHHRHHW